MARPGGYTNCKRLRRLAMGLPTYGLMGVDWEERVRFDRLRSDRLARISRLLAESELGALLCFDMTNIRYITATHIGTWAQDKLNRFCLLPAGRSTDHVGLRLRGAPPPALQPVAGRGALTRRDLDPARGDGARGRAGRERGRQDPGRARGARPARGAGRRRRGRAGRPLRPPGRRDRGRRRPTADAGGARDQGRGRDHAPQHRLHDGRRGLRGALPRDASRDARERVRRAREQGPLRHGLGVRRGGQRDLG